MLKFIFLLLLSLPVQAEILAKAWLIADANGEIIEQSNSTDVQPIASITKLMTAMVVLDSNPNLNEKVKKFRGLTVTKQQLLDLAIVHSDNKAADQLCRTYRLGYQACIADMNRKAQILGMTNTQFRDSTGLDNRNISNAVDLLKLLQAAEHYPAIVNASQQTVVNLQKKKRRWAFVNTNPLVARYDVVVSKTGYVRASGGCMVMTVVQDGVKKFFVVLNSKTTRTRVKDMEHLILSMSSPR
jgi:D-alanyl-D-alanine endopeptidase (penicillin-binding protein 7)